MTTAATTQTTEGLTIRIIRFALLLCVMLLACYVMSLDPNQPY